MLALRSTEVEVVGITCTHGNIGVDLVEGNVCAIADAVGAPAGLRVWVGADRPLVQARDKDATEWHGADGLGGTGLGARGGA